MEATAVRRPPASDERVCGTSINLFRKRRSAFARLARNFNAYHQSMVTAASSSTVGVSSTTSVANIANTDGVSDISTLDATIGRIRDIP